MQTSVILVGLGAAFAAAQGATFPQGFPECGVTCVNNMLNQASDLGCDNNITPLCLCTKPNFIYGVRDCATESCGDDSVAQQVIEYGSQYCANAGVVVSGIPTATGQNPSASTTVIATASPTTPMTDSMTASGSDTVTTHGSVQTFSDHIASIATGSAGEVFWSLLYPYGSSPISTVYERTTISTDGTVTTSVISSSTIWTTTTGSSASITAASGTESGSVITGVTESSITTNGSTLATSVTTTRLASSGTSEGGSESATESATEAGSESASSTSNPAVQRTAAPAGLIAAAVIFIVLIALHCRRSSIEGRSETSVKKSF
ncbi:hypothetical protein F4677DRAFT_440370 [Hypoxylon crocopeplum]|nr:hypothetical protein F4677DRAFT_440370 [Hypoxylon crocopeplum]